MKQALFFLLLLTATGCYRMPTDDDYCVIPATNNPDVTRHRDSAMPSMGY